MKKKKFSLLLEIATLCLCIAAIAFGVYSAKNASLNVSGSVGFIAHNVKFSVESQVKCAETTESGAKIIEFDKKVSDVFESTSEDKKLFTHDIGAINFNDIIVGGNVAVLTLTVNNLSNYALAITMKSLPSFVDNNGAIVTPSDMDVSVMCSNNKVEVNTTLEIQIENSITYVMTFTIPNETLDNLEDMSGKLMLDFTLSKSTIEKDSEGLTYSVSSDGTGAMVTSLGTCADNKIIIPSYVTIDEKSLPVTEISMMALANSKTILSSMGLTEETIPEGFVWQEATYTEIVLPKTIKTIGTYAFGYTAITKIDIPEGVTEIGESAFIESSVTSINLPDTLTKLGQDAFNGCKNLTSVKLSKNISTIGESTFQHCTSLKDVTIPEGISAIAYMQFTNCSSLVSINLPSTLKNMGVSAFENCTSLKTINFAGTIELWNSLNIGSTQDWVKNTLVTQVICSDGAITL